MPVQILWEFLGGREWESQRARDFRKTSTNAERYLWYYLGVNKLGFKFKRQVPIGEDIV
ncbi:DUF559 domain-containing protein [Legionella norrlandica]|uniref:DUF559 domain-containing protein n=1 Tax=Legionella norrlandica TaxID=1498499 RepID=UPI0009DEDAF0|nr:DUF559 domain-containing protein [Legionella norrlandica]